MTRKEVLKTIAALCIFAVIFALLTAVFKPKWNSYHSDQMQTRLQGFYRQEKNSHNVIYLGSSFSYCGISPLKIWDEQKITGYVFSGTGQKAWMSAYYLEEAFKYQTPEVVVYEAGAVLDEKESAEKNNRKSIDYMRWSPTKLKAILEICENTGESKKEYLFPFLRYHSRWTDIGGEDANLKVDSSYFLMGTMSWCATRPVSAKKLAKYEQWDAGAIEGSSLKVGPKSGNAVLKMKKMCEEKGSQFLLVRVPSMSWSLEEAAAVQSFADENAIPYLDMNLYNDEIGIDWKKDTPDKGEHLNIFGCGKASGYLGQYLKDNYEFEERLSGENRKFWEESAKKRDSLENCYMLSQVNQCDEYMRLSDSEEFITMIVVPGTAKNRIPDEIKDTFEKRGLKLPEADTVNEPYVALLDGAKTVFECFGGELSKEKSYIWDDTAFLLSSGDWTDAKQTKALVDGREFEVDKEGINLVVYNKVLRQVVDVVNFDTAKEEIHAEHKSQPMIIDEDVLK